MILGYLEGVISPIILSVVLIVYLIAIEFGDEKMKEVFLPSVVVLILLFCLILARASRVVVFGLASRRAARICGILLPEVSGAE